MKFSVIVFLVGALFVGLSTVGLSHALGKDQPSNTVCGKYNPAANCAAIDCQPAGGGDAMCADGDGIQHPYNSITQIQRNIGSCISQLGATCNDTNAVTACVTMYYQVTDANPKCNSDASLGCEDGIATQVGCP